MLPGAVLAPLLAYVAFTAVGHSLSEGGAPLSAVGWRQQGQAALVLGNGRPAVAAGEQLTERQLLEALLIPSGNNITP